MKNFVKNGDRLSFIAPVGGVKSGEFNVVGAAFGINAISANEGEDCELDVSGGVYRKLPKIETEDWDNGIAIYWNATDKKMTKVKSSNLKVGIANGSLETGTATGTVRLNRSF